MSTPTEPTDQGADSPDDLTDTVIPSETPDGIPTPTQDGGEHGDDHDQPGAATPDC